MHPLGYFASAPNGTLDAAIRSTNPGKNRQASKTTIHDAPQTIQHTPAGFYQEKSDRADVVSHHGPCLERLSIEGKLALRAVLSYYVFYKLRYASNYSIEEAVTLAMPEYTKASILTTILAIEGISTDNAKGLIKFITEQQNWRQSAKVRR